MKASKTAAVDDLFFAGILIFIGGIAIKNGRWIIGGIAAAFGALWVTLRIYHLANWGKLPGTEGD